MINSELGIDIRELVSRPPADTKMISGIGYLCMDAQMDRANPFVDNAYDFEKGFYRGEFDFISPLTGEQLTDTPETFGRHKVVRLLLQRVVDLGRIPTVLDLGCGTLDIARTIPKDQLEKMHLINVDISGPWSVDGGPSALERGTQKLDHSAYSRTMVNAQYNFNESDWPFSPNTFDFIVTNMALHHIAYDLKDKRLEQMYQSLKSEGTIILTDVFNKDTDGAKFTEAGMKGPEECGGSMQFVSDFLKLVVDAGFKLDELGANLAKQDRNYQLGDELEAAKESSQATMAINKAIWFMELRK